MRAAPFALLSYTRKTERRGRLLQGNEDAPAPFLARKPVAEGPLPVAWRQTVA